MFKRIVGFLKETGIVPMTQEDLLERIPKDSLTFEQIKTEVKTMKVGESRRFNFDPRDKAFTQPRNVLISILTLARRQSLYVNYHVNPRKGLYIWEIQVGNFFDDEKI